MRTRARARRSRGLQHPLVVDALAQPQDDAAAVPIGQLNAFEGGVPLARPIHLDPQEPFGGGVLAQFVDRTRSDQPAVGDDRDLVAEALDKLELMAREEHGGALARTLDQRVGEHVDRNRVEPRKRLVEDQHVGLVHERRRELDALLVAERERIDAVLPPLLHAEPLGPAVGCGNGFCLGHSVQARHVHELLVHLHARVEAAFLRHVPEAPAVDVAHGRAVDADDALVGGEHAHHDAHRGRLAGAVRAHEAVETARLHREGEAVEGDLVAVTPRESVQLEKSRHHEPPALRGPAETRRRAMPDRAYAITQRAYRAGFERRCASRGVSATTVRADTDAARLPGCDHRDMAQNYRLTAPRRILNLLMRALLRVGIAPPGTYLLTVRGRHSGTPHSTPVTLVEREDGRWLVAPYGAVGWVRNARAAGRVLLSRGRRSEECQIDEVSGDEAAGVLQAYVRSVRVVRPYFDAAPSSPLTEFAAEISSHPVFRLSTAMDI